jgi:hypothetical protein
MRSVGQGETLVGGKVDSDDIEYLFRCFHNPGAGKSVCFFPRLFSVPS